MLSLEHISPKELVDKVHAKIEKNLVVLHPSVIEKIEHQRIEQASSDKRKNISTVSVADLTRVLRSGVLIALQASSGGWEMTLQGTIAGGENLLVSASVSGDENASVQITHFGTIQKAFMDVVASLSTEEQVTTQEFIEYLRHNGKSTDPTFRAALDSFVSDHRVLLQRLAH